MAQRYDDWDKKRYKTTKSMPWWMKNISKIQHVALWGVLLFGFGEIYQMLLFPSAQQKSRTLDPKYDKEMEVVKKNLEQREKKLIEMALSDDKTYNRADMEEVYREFI